MSRWSAPESLHFCTMSTKYFFSVACRLSNFSTVSMSTWTQADAPPTFTRRSLLLKQSLFHDGLLDDVPSLHSMSCTR